MITVLFYSKRILDDLRVYIDSKGASRTVEARSNFHYPKISLELDLIHILDIPDVPLDVNT